MATARREPDAGGGGYDDGEAYADTSWLPSWRPWVAFALSVAGFGISMYLTLDHFTGTLPVCSASGFIDCKAVTTSQYSYLFHIPVALLGLLFYTALLVANFPAMWRVRSPVVVWGRLAMAVGGMCFVLYLLSRELFSIKAICLWCTGVHIVTFLVFVLVITSLPAMTTRSGEWGDWDEDTGDAALGPA